MAFDRVILFDRTKPAGQKMKGEALDEFLFYINKVVPVTGKSITRADYNPITQKLIIYAFDNATQTEGIIAQVPISSTVSGDFKMVETAPGSRLFRPTAIG